MKTSQQAGQGNRVPLQATKTSLFIDWLTIYTSCHTADADPIMPRKDGRGNMDAGRGKEMMIRIAEKSVW